MTRQPTRTLRQQYSAMLKLVTVCALISITAGAVPDASANTSSASLPSSSVIDGLRSEVMRDPTFQEKVAKTCEHHERAQCQSKASEAIFCTLLQRSRADLLLKAGCSTGPSAFVQLAKRALRTSAPEDDLAKEMTHDLDMNFNKIAPFGKEDTAKELQDHAAKTQDTLVDAVENAEVAEIKRAVFRALTRLRAATIKEFDTIARLETQAIDAYNDAHHYRAENPLAHLHEDEAPVETDKLKSFH